MTTSLHATQDRQLFNDIAEHYCSKDQTDSSRVARQHRLRQTLELVPSDDGQTVLEVGCGAGFSADYLEGHFERFVGVDYADELIRYARVHHGREGVEFHRADIRDFAYNHPFDVVVMIGVLHHFDDIPAVMQHIVELVRPGGWIVANEPQPGNPLVQAARNLRKSVDRTYSGDQVTLGGDELQRLYVDAGLIEVRIQPQGILSTPFAEVVLPPQPITRLLSKAACQVDHALEHTIPNYLNSLSWNLIAAGRKP